MHEADSRFVPLARRASDWLAVAEQAARLRVQQEAAEAAGRPRRGSFYPRLNMSLEPDERCGPTEHNLQLRPPLREFFSAELFAQCRTPHCRDLHFWLASENLTTTTVQDDDAKWAACGASPSMARTTKSAALLLRGRLPGTAYAHGVMRGYTNSIVCPLRNVGFLVDVFVTTYEPLSDALRDVLQPTVVSILPYRNSSNLLSTLASLYALLRFVREERQGRSYTFVVLTRMDLRLKQPINELPGLSSPSSGGFRGFKFIFKEGEANWRGLNRSSPCRLFQMRRRVSDTFHTFGGELLPCVLRSLEHYLLHEKEALHYISHSLPYFVPRTQISFLVPGCYDSNPANGMRNPVYDIVPRNRHYNNSICRHLGEFEYENATDSFCCASERYCCPNTQQQCPRRSARSHKVHSSG